MILPKDHIGQVLTDMLKTLATLESQAELLSLLPTIASVSLDGAAVAIRQAMQDMQLGLDNLNEQNRQ